MVGTVLSDMIEDSGGHVVGVADLPADAFGLVVEHRPDIDDAITTYAHGWSLERMPAVDRAILRLGAFEVLYSTDVPGPVAISEAVSLAKDLSTDDSPTFVNGVLGRLLEVKPTLL